MDEVKRIIDNSLLVPEIARLVAEGKSVTLKTKGNSMLPFIRGERDSVLLVNPGEIKLYDIVLAKTYERQYVLHRVVSIDGNRLKLMGDGNLRECETCSLQDILAVAVEIIKKNSTTYNCRSNWHRWQAVAWYVLLPVRKYMLAIYKIMDKIIGL